MVYCQMELVSLQQTIRVYYKRYTSPIYFLAIDYILLVITVERHIQTNEIEYKVRSYIRWSGNV